MKLDTIDIAELLIYLEKEMEQAKHFRDENQGKNKEKYIYFQGALDEARQLYFHFTTISMKKNPKAWSH